MISVGTPATAARSLGWRRHRLLPRRDHLCDDSFTFPVRVGALTATATVAVTVDPVEDAPVIQSVASRAVNSSTWIVTVTGIPDGTVPEAT